MARTRNLILPIEVKVAKKLCKCSHNNKHQIVRGSLRFVVKESGGMGEKGYCTACAQAMLLAALQRIDELQRSLGASPDPR